MKNIIKTILIKLSNNEKVLKISKKIFIYFPSLKYDLIEFVYGNGSFEKINKVKYTNNFLDDIKKEVLERKLRLRK